MNINFDFPLLNFPNFEFKIKKEFGKFYIFSITRSKYLLVTPEEWVRQHLIHYLIFHLNYPKVLIKEEYGIKFSNRTLRADIAVLHPKGFNYLLVECKAYNVSINFQNFQQAGLYNSVIKSKYLLICNGLNNICIEPNFTDGTYKELYSIPPFIL